MSLMQQIIDLASRTGTEFKNIRNIFNLPDTSFFNQVGVIQKNGIPFLHNFSYGNNGSVTPSGHNLFMGKNSGNFLLGANATTIDHASYLIGIGTETLQSVTTANWCIAIGYQALKNKTIGGGCYAIGYQSQLANVDGVYNVSLGTWTLFSNVSGGSNVAIGYKGLYSNTDSNNTIIGARALYTKGAGADNLAAGYYAGFNLGSGAQNVLLGSNSALLNAAGGNLTSLNNSVLIGYGARANASGETNQIVIGHNVIGNGSNTVTIGNDSIIKTIIKGSVCIGGTTPLGKLHTVVSSYSDTTIFERNGQTSNVITNSLRVLATKTTDMANGFGVGTVYLIQDDAGVQNNIGVVGAERAGSDSTGDIIISPSVNGTPTQRVRIKSTGNTGFSVDVPTAIVHLKAGTASAGTAPLKFSSGTNLTTPEPGAIEYDGSNLFYTNNTARKQVSNAPEVITGKTVTIGSWSLVSGIYEASISDSAITANSIVDVIPDTASTLLTLAAVMLPRTDSSSGAVKIYAYNLPAATITVSLIITDKKL